ncbi:uncharacterized protein LOC129594821 [Paramacrobiotus metropolitanus]|uniref:uncharacterized protein LOC129594821 n=1 Tax=Paramacrobiotus metropolitanus TaxID=2943436 RepID=UPI0024457728|nr:uncharacterized protein LOC129594821 [Paramacrobiotus metropolitanus]
MTRREPTVKRFPVHLPDGNMVVFREGEESSIQNASERLSDLERYFSRPNDELFDSLKYLEYYERYEVTNRKFPARVAQHLRFRDQCGDKSRNVFQLLKPIVCRMDVKLLRHGEVWYLRLLLQHKAARSFEELLTVDDVKSSSFAQAAQLMGLLENSSEAHICMEEAAKRLCSPYQLRTLFCLLTNDGAPALELFETHKDYMVKDFQVSQKLSEEEALEVLLHELSERFESFCKSLGDFGLPVPKRKLSEITKETMQFDAKTCAAEATESIEKLNDGQRGFFVSVLTNVENGTGGAYYLDGGPGRGKSFLLKTVINYFRGMKKIVLCCASTGFVAVMYDGGRTAHNLFRLDVYWRPLVHIGTTLLLLPLLLRPRLYYNFYASHDRDSEYRLLRNPQQRTLTATCHFDVTALR